LSLSAQTIVTRILFPASKMFDVGSSSNASSTASPGLRKIWESGESGDEPHILSSNIHFSFIIS